MSLTDKERDILIELHLEKSGEFLSQADKMIEIEMWDIAANRYYYACFHAVQALLLKNQITCHSHSGLIACFGQNFIKTGILPKGMGAFLSRMEQLRQKGDYNCCYSVTEDEVKTMVEPSHKLIIGIKELIWC